MTAASATAAGLSATEITDYLGHEYPSLTMSTYMNASEAAQGRGD